MCLLYASVCSGVTNRSENTIDGEKLYDLCHDLANQIRSVVGLNLPRDSKIQNPFFDECLGDWIRSAVVKSTEGDEFSEFILNRESIPLASTRVPSGSDSVHRSTLVSHWSRLSFSFSYSSSRELGIPTKKTWRRVHIILSHIRGLWSMWITNGIPRR